LKRNDHKSIITHEEGRIRPCRTELLDRPSFDRQMNSETSFNMKDSETWLHTYSWNFVTGVDPSPRKIKQPIILCLQQ